MHLCLYKYLKLATRVKCIYAYINIWNWQHGWDDWKESCRDLLFTFLWMNPDESVVVQLNRDLNLLNAGNIDRLCNCNYILFWQPLQWTMMTSQWLTIRTSALLLLIWERANWTPWEHWILAWSTTQPSTTTCCFCATWDSKHRRFLQCPATRASAAHRIILGFQGRADQRHELSVNRHLGPQFHQIGKEDTDKHRIRF